MNQVAHLLIRPFLIFCFILCVGEWHNTCKAQALEYVIKPYNIVSLKATDRHGFWSYSNQGGRFSPFNNQSVSGIEAEFLQPLWLGFNFTVYADVFYSTYYGPTAQDYGVDISNRWVTAGYGTKHQDIGVFYHPHSSGSFVVSGNAKPFERLYAGTNGFVPLFILGKYSEYFLINGYISHTEFQSRDISRERLHYKALYGHALKPLPISLYGGLAHMAFWGGYDDVYGNMDNRWSTLFNRIFWAIGGGDIGPETELAYTVGNHIGVFDYGVLFNLDEFSVDIYRTYLVEDRDGLNYKNLWEGAYGSIFTLKNHRWFNSLTYEFIYTKRQSGDTPPPLDNSRGSSGGWDNYYNHYIYTNGWSNNNFTIGNPLLFTNFIAGRLNYTQGFLAIPNNRIVAHHIGLDYSIDEVYSGTTYVTYTRNYGTYHQRYWAKENNEPYFFENGPRQWYVGTFLRRKMHFYQPGELTIGLFADFGQVFKTQLSSTIQFKWFIQSKG